MPSSLERPQLRKLIEDTLRTDADLDAFLLDYFPETKKQCTDGMTRIQKLNLLLEKEDTDEILNALHHKRPQLAGGSRAGVTAQQDASPRIVDEPDFSPKPNSAQLESPDSLPPPRYFLHLSDLHFSDENQADQWHAQLLLDLRKQMKIRELSGVIVSGDITNHATIEQFGFAQDFFRQLCTSFRVAGERLILVPGNHDVNWKLTDAGQDGFSPFAAFYRSVTGSDYPSSPAQQTTLHHFPDLKLLVLGCNSACQIDRANPSRAGLHKRAFGKAISSLVTNEDYEGSTKLVVWHHPPSELTQETELLDGAVLEQLAQAGFQLILHGHVHRADNAEFRYYRQVSGRGMEILTAGTFGAPTHELVSGYPFQYQVLEFRGDHLTVHTRKRENVAGGWIADHRWSQAPGQSPASFYQIRLRGSRTGPHPSISRQASQTMVLAVFGGLISLLLVAILVAVLTRSHAPTIIVVPSSALFGRMEVQGVNPEALDTPERFADKLHDVKVGQYLLEVSVVTDKESGEPLYWVLALRTKDNQIIAATKYSWKQQKAWTARLTPQTRMLAELAEGIDRKLEQHTLFDFTSPTLGDMMITSQDLAGERLDLAVVDMGKVLTWNKVRPQDVGLVLATKAYMTKSWAEAAKHASQCEDQGEAKYKCPWILGMATCQMMRTNVDPKKRQYLDRDLTFALVLLREQKESQLAKEIEQSCAALGVSIGSQKQLSSPVDLPPIRNPFSIDQRSVRPPSSR